MTVLITTVEGKNIDIGEVITSPEIVEALEKLNLSMILQDLHLDLYLSNHRKWISVYIDDSPINKVIDQDDRNPKCLIDFSIDQKDFNNIVEIISKRIYEWKLKNSN